MLVEEIISTYTTNIHILRVKKINFRKVSELPPLKVVQPRGKFTNFELPFFLRNCAVFRYILVPCPRSGVEGVTAYRVFLDASIISGYGNGLLGV
jgi:hypothetical protein